MKHMEVAWGQVGTAEVPGAVSNPKIINYFKQVGREDITSEATAWCGAFTGFCLREAGIPLAMEPDDVLLARAYLKQGTPIEVPRYGAIAVFSRDGGEPWWGHVGFVVGWTEHHIELLSGNRANSVNVARFPRASLLGLRWPVPPATSADVAAAGSRTVVAATEAKGAAGKAAAVQVVSQAQPPSSPDLGVKELAQEAGSFRSAIETFASFAEFCWQKWPVIAFGLTLYWVLKAGWHTRLIGLFRTEDHNSGANGGRQ